MARTRSFDEDRVLDAAMHAFRRHGYTGLSVKQLEAETGLTSGSLYNAYGSKDGIFEAALDHYIDGLVIHRIRTHAGEAAGLDDLEGLFLTLLQTPLADGFGCLVTNSAVEFGATPSIATRGIDRTFSMLRLNIEKLLTREIGPGEAASATTRLLFLYHGMLVLARAGRMPDSAAQAIKAEFDTLRTIRLNFSTQKGEER